MMSKLTPTEIGALILALVLIGVGLIVIIHPLETVISHFTNDGATGWPGTNIELVGRPAARVYGVLSVLVGCGLAVFVLYPKKR